MIVREFHSSRSDGVDLYVTKSDKGMMIRKIGTDELYDAAIDVDSALFFYAETDTPIQTSEDNADGI